MSAKTKNKKVMSLFTYHLEWNFVLTKLFWNQMVLKERAAACKEEIKKLS